MTEATKTLHAPTVNINGSSREALLEAYCTAGEAVKKALEATLETSPHGRDYVLAPDIFEHYRKARLEHEKRCAALRGIYFELQALAEAVDMRECFAPVFEGGSS